MKFLARRSDGQIVGRFADANVRFPLSSDIVVMDSPVDILEGDLPSGSSLAAFLAAKIVSLRNLHPLFTYSLEMCEEMMVPNCDLVHSSLVTRGPGKTTIVRPGGKMVSETIACDDTVSFCFRYNVFVMGSPTGKPNLRYYNFDETLQEFVTPDVAVSMVDAVDPNSVLDYVMFDAEGTTGYFPNFRMAFENSGSVPLFVSGWTFVTHKEVVPEA
jgi:hypothetical protein